MTKLYGLCLLGLMSMSHASQAPEGGKLPEGFTFKKCADDDVECLNERTSFMKQYKSYQSKIKIGNSRVVIINSDIDMIVSNNEQDGETVITFTQVNKKA